MARAARVIGEGGVIGWFLEDTIAFLDDANPTFSTIQLSFKGYDIVQDSFSFDWVTTSTQAAIRSAAKDAIRQRIIDTLGVAVPRANIKMMNSPE